LESQKREIGIHRRYAGHPARSKGASTTVSLCAKPDSRAHQSGDATNEVNTSTAISGAWRTGL
jgi:hypothetical protein